jgi:hypothetical protein
MGWELRRGKLVYYRKVREGGRVRSIYCGAGARGEQAAREDAARRECKRAYNAAELQCATPEPLPQEPQQAAISPSVMVEALPQDDFPLPSDEPRFRIRRYAAPRCFLTFDEALRSITPILEANPHCDLEALIARLNVSEFTRSWLRWRLAYRVHVLQGTDACATEP